MKPDDIYQSLRSAEFGKACFLESGVTEEGYSLLLRQIAGRNPSMFWVMERLAIYTAKFTNWDRDSWAYTSDIGTFAVRNWIMNTGSKYLSAAQSDGVAEIDQPITIYTMLAMVNSGNINELPRHAGDVDRLIRTYGWDKVVAMHLAGGSLEDMVAGVEYVIDSETMSAALGVTA